MSVTVRTNRHGYLYFRIYADGREYPVGTKYKDDRRKLVEAKATLIEDALAQGKKVHEALIAVIGDCPPRLMPNAAESEKRNAGITISEACDQFVRHLEAWVERGDARKSLLAKTRIYVKNVIKPHFQETPLADLTLARLVEFQTDFMRRKRKRVDPNTGKAKLVPVSLKTAKNVISGHLKKAVKRARAIHGVPIRDPFDGLEWPKRKNPPEPDPFTAKERDEILAFFREKRDRWYPWIGTLFWAGLRQGESTALRRTDHDTKGGSLRVTKSRSEGEENDPKTPRSVRTIKLLPEALAALELLPEPIHPDPDAYLFVNPNGDPINSKEWPKKSFYPVLRKLGIRVRKFYCTRHTFITEMIGRGENLKAIAEYCGTSVAMIERSYGKWLPKGMDGSVKALGAGTQPGTFGSETESKKKKKAKTGT